MSQHNGIVFNTAENWNEQIGHSRSNKNQMSIIHDVPCSGTPKNNNRRRCVWHSLAHFLALHLVLNWWRKQHLSHVRSRRVRECPSSLVLAPSEAWTMSKRGAARFRSFLQLKREQSVLCSILFFLRFVRVTDDLFCSAERRNTLHGIELFQFEYEKIN